eukprot:7410267-Ditylum_brightwellii.AAC.1
MEQILEGTSKSIKVKVMQERVQQWLANQQNASWIVETLCIKIDEVPVLVIWYHTIASIPDEHIRTMKNDQAVAGINAGYKEIVKLSQFLLNAPILFATFIDPKYGPALSRAVVNIVEESETNWMDYQFDNTWGIYKQQNETED